MQDNLDMFTLKIHKIGNAVFFILFFIYAVSPLTTPLKESRKYLAKKETFKAKDVAIFFIDFFIRLLSKMMIKKAANRKMKTSS